MMPVQPNNFVRQHWPFILLLLAFLIAACWLTFRLPAFSTPNEVLHYEYAAILRRTGNLPDPAQSQRMDERHQPPLYYSLTALVGLVLPEPIPDHTFKRNPFLHATINGNHNPFVRTTPESVSLLYAGRLTSTLLAAMALISIYGAANRAHSREIGLLVAAIMAFQPMFLYLSASLSNDVAVTAMAAILLAFTTELIVSNKGPVAYVLWGILFAAALLTKASAIFLFTLLLFACFTKWRSTGRHIEAVKCALAGCLGFVPIYAIWLLFNQIRNLDPLGLSRSLPLRHVLALNPSDLMALREHLFRLWSSFWLDWSSGEIGYTLPVVYILSACGLLIMLAGWLKRPPRSGQNRILASMHLVWPIPLVILFAGVKALMVDGLGFLVPEGRWLLPILPSLAWLSAVGWSRWWSKKKRRAALFGMTGLVTVSTLSLMLILIPEANPLPRRLAEASQIPDDAESVGFLYGSDVTLLAVQTSELVNDRPATIRYYWRAETDVARDYSVVTSLVIPSHKGWDIIGRAQTYPGRGMAPTGDWQADELVEDEITVRPKTELHGPTLVLLVVTLAEGESVLPVTLNERSVDAPIAARLALRRAEKLEPRKESLLAEPVSFDHLLELVGVSTKAANGRLQVTLWWKAQGMMETDYTVFIHMLDQRGELVSQSDSMPNRGRSPTNLWVPGDVIRDVHELPDRPPPGGRLLIGVYNLATSARLTARQNGQPIVDNAYVYTLP